MSASLTLEAGASLCHLPPLSLAGGGTLSGGVLGYDRVGHAFAPTVLVLGGISATCRIGAGGRGGSPGWWESLMGAGRPLDPTRWQILGVDYLGGPGASSSPPVAATTDDQARAIEALLDALGIERLDCVIGASFGGQVGQKLAARAPHRAGQLVSLCAPFATTPLARAWRSIQQQIIALGVDVGREREAVALARQLAMTTYRSAGEMAVRFPRRDASAPDALAGWLAARGEAFARTFGGREYAALSSSIDRHAQDPAELRVPTTVVGIVEDQLVPIDELRDDASRLQNGRFVELSSTYGHDGFLKETRAIADVIEHALSTEVSEVLS